MFFIPYFQNYALFLGISTLFFTNALFGATIFLENDSPFVLTAVVHSNSGLFLGQETLPPAGNSRESERKATKLSIPNNYSQSVTPYTVVWKCPNGEYFSICRNVNSGDYVQATLCPGSYSCNGKRSKEQNRSSSPPRRK
ncbi:MAG: hypothetical protein AAGI90_00600 [Chlamydiota bacterium]